MGGSRPQRPALHDTATGWRRRMATDAELIEAGKRITREWGGPDRGAALDAARKMIGERAHKPSADGSLPMWAVLAAGSLFAEVSTKTTQIEQITSMALALIEAHKRGAESGSVPS